MAKYVGFTRTNYFSVTDVYMFRQVIDNSYCSSGDIDIFEESVNGSVKYAFGCYGSICGTRELLDDNDDEGDYDVFITELQSIIPDGEAIIITEVGYENLRCLTGHSHVITKSNDAFVNLGNKALEEARVLLNNPDYDTKMEYQGDQVKKITLPVTWEVNGVVYIEAESVEAAIEYFNKNSDHIPLPKEFEYTDSSFTLADSDPEFVKLYNCDGTNVI